jgi:hypothetical protein
MSRHHTGQNYVKIGKTTFENVSDFSIWGNACDHTYLLHGATVLVELWPPHMLCVRFHDGFLQGGVVSPTPNPQPGGPGYLS